MWPNSHDTADLITFTEEIFNGKLHFLCNACFFQKYGGYTLSMQVIYEPKYSRIDQVNLWRTTFEKLERYGQLKQTISLQIFKGCLPQILLGLFFNTLTHI